MAQIFPKWANKIPAVVVAALILGIGAAGGFFWYYGSPKYIEVGYRPAQPVPFSHKLHAGDLGLDCRYCHSQVEQSAHANIPAPSICMNCHSVVLKDSPKLAPIREAVAANRPVQWVRVHKVPDYAYFDHSAHLRAGVSCFTCHGNIPQQDVVTLREPLSMGWCLDCHRNPTPNLRPPSEIANFQWTPPVGALQFAANQKEQLKVNPPTDCSGCHR